MFRIALNGTLFTKAKTKEWLFVFGLSGRMQIIFKQHPHITTLF